ncbi:MAG: hypothetical protein OXP66_12970 [Candidatus Tectomicrobia bacterium]|nr:hypothetical protein [Candidatus Tectomicrobia bacterium]
MTRGTTPPDSNQITFSDPVEGRDLVLTPTEGAPVRVRFTGPWRFEWWDPDNDAGHPAARGIFDIMENRIDAGGCRRQEWRLALTSNAALDHSCGGAQ